MRLGQKYVKSLVGFLGDLKAPKINSEINWPLKLTTASISRFMECFNIETSMVAESTTTGLDDGILILSILMKFFAQDIPYAKW